MPHDITAQLMGDPGTSYRRPPSPAEMGRDCHEIKWSRSRINPVSPKRRRYTKTSIMWTMKPGDRILRMTKGQTIYLYQRLIREGYGASMERNRCGGGWYVTRTT